MRRLIRAGLVALVISTGISSVDAQDANVKLEAVPIDTTPQTVAGVIVDEAGHPIAGVRVEARTPVTGFHSSFSMPTGGDAFKPPRIAVTDAQGRFDIADIPLFGEREVQLSLKAKHRHVNDQNYPVGQDLRIEMSGSGQPGVIQARLVGVATDHPIVPFDEVRVVRRHVAKAYTFAAEDGRFVLPSEVTLGNHYMIYVYAKGYAATAGKVKAVRAGADEYQEIALPARPALRGKLVDAQTGDPIAGAAILNGRTDEASYFQWSDFEKHVDGYHSLTYVQHETSNAEGEFWFAEVDDQSLGTIFVLKDGYQRFVLRPDVRLYAPNTHELIVPVPRESVFTGIVVQDGKPIANAGVSVQLSDHKEKMQQWNPHTKTDAEGRYRFGGLPPGHYVVFAGPYARRVAIEEAETVELNFGNDLGEIRIWGQAPARATIRLRPEFDWDYSNLETKADESGQYECRGLKPGPYTALVHVPGSASGYLGHHYHLPEFVVERDGQEVDLRSERHRKKDERVAGDSAAD
jgi:protocatechuate 3,4-dioxygenase beta subunit